MNSFSNNEVVFANIEDIKNNNAIRLNIDSINLKLKKSATFDRENKNKAMIMYFINDLYTRWFDLEDMITYEKSIMEAKTKIVSEIIKIFII